MKDGETFVGPKKDGTIQLVMENVNNILSNKDVNLKLDSRKKWLIKNDIEVVCWIESSVLWHPRKRHELLPELMKSGIIK